MPRAIVTGADGFVGSYLVKELVEHDYEVLAVDLPPKPNRLVPQKGLQYLQFSVDNPSFLENYRGFDVLFHLAWAGSSGPARADESVQLGNALTSARLLRAAAKNGIKRFVMAGSIMEFETYDVIYEDGSKPGSGYIYGAGKAIAHEILKPIANSLGIDLVYGYITNAYGVGERSPRFLNSTLIKLIGGEVPEFTSGIQNYDFIYVSDVAKAFRFIAERGLPGYGYMIGSGQAKPLREFVTEIFEEIVPSEKPRFGDVPYTGAMTPLRTFDTSLLRGLGFIPEVSFKEGIRRTYEWLKNQK